MNQSCSLTASTTFRWHCAPATTRSMARRSSSISLTLWKTASSSTTSATPKSFSIPARFATSGLRCPGEAARCTSSVAMSFALIAGRLSRTRRQGVRPNDRPPTARPSQHTEGGRHVQHEQRMVIVDPETGEVIDINALSDRELDALHLHLRFMQEEYTRLER